MAGTQLRAALAGTIALVVLLAASGESTAAAGHRCTIVGTRHADHLRGTPHADVICGRGGADTVNGRGGNDWIRGGWGRDTLIGGKGNDTLIGGPGNDRLRGGRGADRLFGGAGRNSCRDRLRTVMRGCNRRHQPVAVPYGPPAPLSPSAPVSPTTEPDTEPPTLQSLRFTNENVEISQGDWWAELTMSVWDATGLESALLTIEGPEGPWRQVNFESEESPTAKLSSKLDVPASTPIGEYWVTQVTLVDEAGNSVTHGAAWLGEVGFAAHFEVYDGPDREAPNLAGLSFKPTDVDTSQGPITIQIPIEVTDPGSGVKRVALAVANPTSKPSAERIYRTSPTLVSGTAREGTWLASIELPSGATAGFYPVKELELEDFEHHWTVFNSESLEGDGFPGGFAQVGAADTTKPEITSFSIEPQVIHTAGGERKIEVDIGATDDWSGVADWPDPIGRIRFMLTPPDWPVSWGMSGSMTELIAGTDLNGTWRLNRWLEEDAGIGIWTVRWISVTDRAGNTTRLEDASLEEFEAEGWDLTFENLP